MSGGVDPRYGAQDVSAVVNGVAVHHRRPGPWAAEKFRTGFACVLNGDGINWLYMPDAPGATLLSHRDADAVCAALNEAGA